MSKGSRKQHFVPQLLLRQFADAHERLYAYDMATDRSFPTSVRDAGHRNHFLSVPKLDGADGPGAHHERMFQAYEGPAMAAIRAIAEAVSAGVVGPVGHAERHALSRFIAVQYIRTPAAREQAFQIVELMRRVLATEVAARNGFDTSDPKIARTIARFAAIPVEQHAELHAEHMLQQDYIEDLAAMFERHVWLLGMNRTDEPLYVADHPVAVYGHVKRPGRGLGPASYGAEVQLPLTSDLQLSLIERRLVEVEVPALLPLDGRLYASLTPDNVKFERSLQVHSAQRFVYCKRDDFALVKEMCDADPELRDPYRARVEVVAFGRIERPARKR